MTQPTPIKAKRLIEVKNRSKLPARFVSVIKNTKHDDFSIEGAFDYSKQEGFIRVVLFIRDDTHVKIADVIEHSADLELLKSFFVSWK